jgi:hypothetical protein
MDSRRRGRGLRCSGRSRPGDLWTNGGAGSRERLPIAADYDAETTRKGLAAAPNGEAPKKLERLVDLYRKGGADMTHADIAHGPLAEPTRLIAVVLNPFHRAYILTGPRGFNDRRQ